MNLPANVQTKFTFGGGFLYVRLTYNIDIDYNEKSFNPCYR